jgi:hypothetical protein
MWVPAGAIFTLVGVALFAAWLGQAGRRAALGSVALASRRSEEAATFGEAPP